MLGRYQALRVYRLIRVRQNDKPTCYVAYAIKTYVCRVGPGRAKLVEKQVGENYAFTIGDAGNVTKAYQVRGSDRVEANWSTYRALEVAYADWMKHEANGTDSPYEVYVDHNGRPLRRIRGFENRQRARMAYRLASATK